MSTIEYAYVLNGSYMLDAEEEKMLKERYHGDVKTFFDANVDAINEGRWTGELANAVLCGISNEH